MTPRRPTYLNPKGRGNQSLCGKREAPEDMYGTVSQRLCAKVKAKLPESQCPAVQLLTPRDHVCDRGNPEPQVFSMSGVGLAGAAMGHELIEGHAWETYSVLET
jgi:hypothetical protein